MATRKIELMHQLFGVNGEGLCKECSNFGRYLVGPKNTVRKCSVYGLTHSLATDWCASYPVCGLFNRAYVGRNIVEMVKPGKGPEENDNEPLPGQIDILARGGTD